MKHIWLVTYGEAGCQPQLRMFSNLKRARMFAQEIANSRELEEIEKDVWQDAPDYCVITREVVE